MTALPSDMLAVAQRLRAQAATGEGAGGRATGTVHLHDMPTPDLLAREREVAEQLAALLAEKARIDAEKSRRLCESTQAVQRLPTPKPLEGKARLAAEWLLAHQGSTGNEIAAAIDLEPVTFRTHIVPVLREHGLRNDRRRGYRFVTALSLSRDII